MTFEQEFSGSLLHIPSLACFLPQAVASLPSQPDTAGNGFFPVSNSTSSRLFPCPLGPVVTLSISGSQQKGTKFPRQWHSGRLCKWHFTSSWPC